MIIYLNIMHNNRPYVDDIFPSDSSIFEHGISSRRSAEIVFSYWSLSSSTAELSWTILMFFDTQSIRILSQNKEAVGCELLPPIYLTDENWFSSASWFTFEVSRYLTPWPFKSLRRCLILLIDIRIPVWYGCYNNFPLLFKKYMVLVTSSISSNTLNWSFLLIPKKS